MNKTIGWVVVILIIIGIIWWAESRPASTPVGNSEPIKIGVIAPLSGPVADYGEEIRKGAQAGVVAGAELVFEDEKCDAKEAVSAFQKLVEFQHINFIVGPACGSPQEAVVPLLKGKPIITVVPAAASADLFAQSGGNFYNIQYSLQAESKFVAEKMFALGYKKVGLVSYGTAFSQTHAAAFRQAFPGQIVADETILDENSDLLTETTKIAAAKVDAVYSPDIYFFFRNGLNRLRERKVVAPIFSTYVVELPAARALVPDVFYSFPSDLAGPEGAVYELSKQATRVLSQAALDCRGAYACVKSKLDSSGQFDDQGVFKRGFILKQIKNGVPVEVK